MVLFYYLIRDNCNAPAFFALAIIIIHAGLSFGPPCVKVCGISDGRTRYLQVRLISKQVRFYSSQSVSGEAESLQTTKISECEAIETA